jgi:hypothetical protein
LTTLLQFSPPKAAGRMDAASMNTGRSNSRPDEDYSLALSAFPMLARLIKGLSSRRRRRDPRGGDRIRAIEALGFTLHDQPGWIDGSYAKHRYRLERNGVVVAGPFTTLSVTILAARSLSSNLAR